MVTVLPMSQCICARNLFLLWQYPLPDLGGLQLICCTWFWGALASVLFGSISARDIPATVPIRQPTQRADLPTCAGWLCWVKADMKENSRQIFFFRCKAFGVLFPFISRMFVFMHGCSRGHNHTEKQIAKGWLEFVLYDVLQAGCLYIGTYLDKYNWKKGLRTQME